MTKQRPSVDSHVWDASEQLLELSNKFNALREDIRTDMKWELARRIQQEWEAFYEEKLND
jgi:hypothetical protein